MKTEYNTNGTINIEASGDIFIIPNHAAKLEQYFPFAQDDMKALGTTLCENVGKSFDKDSEYFIETWITSDDLESDNIADHGFNFTIGLEPFRVASGEIRRDIPRSVIDIKEGETTKVIFTELEGYSLMDRSKTVKVNLTLNLTANQSDYRYYSSGKFEKVLDKVCA